MRASFASVIHLALLSIAAAWWESDDLACDFRPQQHLKVGDEGKEVCITMGQALCRDNENLFGAWKFGVDEDTGAVVLNHNGRTVYQDFPGASQICFGEESPYESYFDSSLRRQPYLSIEDECNGEVLAELNCRGVDEEDFLTLMKMTDNSNIDDIHKYPVNVVKFKKGNTEERSDDNSLWSVDVDFKDGTYELEGRVSVNEKYCHWDEYYSSAKCDYLNCESIDCCDVYADDQSFVFPQCENSDFCKNIDEQVVVDVVEQTWDDICKDLGIESTGEKIDILTGGQKGRMEDSLTNFFNAIVTCEEGGESGECLNQEQRLNRKGMRRLSDHDAEPAFDTLYVTITSFDQFEACSIDDRQLLARGLRRQKSKGNFNRVRKARNRRRRRATRRRSRRLNIRSFNLRRLAQNLQCPPNLASFYQENGFTSVEEAIVDNISGAKDCNNPDSDACKGTGDETSAPCCGIVDGCACKFTSEGQCEANGCSSTSLCCEFDICKESASCKTPAPSPAPTPEPTLPPTPSLCEGVTCPSCQSCHPSDGSCKADDELVPCVAVIDEDDDFGIPDQATRWAEFRAEYPFRPFCLLIPGDMENVGIPPAFFSDPNTRHFEVTRDFGDISLDSDWAALCGLDSVGTSAVAFVGQFIDNSGSMYESHVAASRDKFYETMAKQGVEVVTVVDTNENWILPFLTTLVPGDLANCTNYTIP